MSRPWRIEYECAFYHVFPRGKNQQNIFLNDGDRYLFLDTIGDQKNNGTGAKLPKAPKHS